MIQAIPLTGVSLVDIQAEFEGMHREKLMAIQAGSGTGRDGHNDGWIREGFSNYRPYLATELDIRHNLGLNTWDAITLIKDYNKWVYQVMYDHMLPGGELATHVDGAPYYERWHLPIYSQGCMFVEGEGSTQQAIVMREGYWYGPISYWLPHSIRNDTAQERVHMIVDFGPVIR